MTSSTAWPAGVIARYLTVAGVALSDPALHVAVIDESRIGRVYVRCQGCAWADFYSTGGLMDDTDAQNSERVAGTLPGARELAQSHAETCRAMPNPNA